MDLRKNYEKKTELRHGFVYLKSNIVQTWESYWLNDGIQKKKRETLMCRSCKQAKEVFADFC